MILPEQPYERASGEISEFSAPTQSAESPPASGVARLTPANSDRSNVDSHAVMETVGRENSGTVNSEPASDIPSRSAGSPVSHGTLADTEDAQARANICEEFLRLTSSEGGHSLRTAARVLGKSASWFSGHDSMLRRYQRGGVQALITQRGTVGAPPSDLTLWIDGLAWFIPAARFFNLLSNRTYDSGSVPEAIRRVISLPHVPVGWTESVKRRFLKAVDLEVLPECPKELREDILARERAGKDLVPESVARKISVNPTTVRWSRNKREAALDFLNTPGGMRLFTDELTGVARLARAGEIMEADDSTVNFPVCVPWQRDGSDDPCVQKYGVKVARFQWLVAIDVGTSFVSAFSYTARPRSSYRSEDIVSLVRTLTRQHGVPKMFRFERGAWEALLVKSTLKLLGAKLDTVYSPHQKPFIEGLFNTLWTKLSVQFPGGHVGRFQGEEREANLLFAACKTGAKDPRRYFPMLASAIAAFQEVINEKNRTPVNSKHHGRWIPEERWERELDTRKVDAAADWMFAPFVREWTVKGMNVGGLVPIIEGQRGVPFDFSAPWLAQFHGAKVKCHFDPADHSCSAGIVLAQNCNNQSAGTVLGSAPQINEHAGYIRKVMGWQHNTHGICQTCYEKIRADINAERAKIQTGEATCQQS